LIDAALLAALLISFCSGAVFGLVGFGFALISVTPLLQLYDPPTVVTLSIALTIVTSFVVVAGAHDDIHRRTVLTMLPGALIGLVAGAQLLRVLDAEAIKLIASCVVLLFTVALLRGVTLPRADASSAAAASGSLSGLLATSTGLSGPPVVMLLTARKLAPHPFRVTISAYFLCINIVGFAILIGQGTVGASQLSVTAALLPAAILGTVAGRQLAQLISPASFRRIILLLLVLTGVLGIVTTLPGVPL
jgi:uncharacterized protein